MSRPEYIYDILTKTEGQKSQTVLKRPLLEKIGSAFIMVGLIGVGVGLVIGTPSTAPFLTSEFLSGTETIGFTIAKGSAVVAAAGLGIYFTRKVASYVVGVLEDLDKVGHH